MWDSSNLILRVLLLWLCSPKNVLMSPEKDARGVLSVTLRNAGWWWSRAEGPAPSAGLRARESGQEDCSAERDHSLLYTHLRSQQP